MFEVRSKIDQKFRFFGVDWAKMQKQSEKNLMQFWPRSCEIGLGLVRVGLSLVHLVLASLTSLS